MRPLVPSPPLSLRHTCTGPDRGPMTVMRVMVTETAASAPPSPCRATPASVDPTVGACRAAAPANARRRRAALISTLPARLTEEPVAGSLTLVMVTLATAPAPSTFSRTAERTASRALRSQALAAGAAAASWKKLNGRLASVCDTRMTTRRGTDEVDGEGESVDDAVDDAPEDPAGALEPAMTTIGDGAA